VIKRNYNGDFVITKGGLAFLSVIIGIVVLLFSFFTYSIGKAVEFTSVKERVRYLEIKSAETEKCFQELRTDIQQVKEDIQKIREDIILIKVKIGIINKK